ncbi:hypothetical protein [Thermincola potens]|uniref:3D domain protein n=1 Tax=Thermincola potens (strain JR) TaxID=635013 RepID=D5XBB4_THEPJ|nr:hypothetical protein [Thermincola potens]ADG81434.1 hypothetical protein TherJR_0557 [Thermincola potens JR]
MLRKSIFKWKSVLAITITVLMLMVSALSAFAAAEKNNAEKKDSVDIKEIEKTLEALDNELYKKNPENVERPPDIIKAIEDGTVDLGVAPDSIANILGVRVDYESNPILMYPADPYSWGRHLLGDKTWQNGNLYLTTYGYTTEYSGGGTNACAVPYYWSDVKKGDPVRVRNLENQTYVITGYRSDFGPNQKKAGDHICDLGSGLNNQLHGNGHTYSRTWIWIRGGDHY